jgi:hypothetical protein
MCPGRTENLWWVRADSNRGPSECETGDPSEVLILEDINSYKIDYNGFN